MVEETSETNDGGTDGRGAGPGSESAPEEPGALLPVLLLAAGAVQVGGILGAALIDTTSGDALFGVAFSTVPVFLVVSFIDVRRVRRYTAAVGGRSRPVTEWSPPVRGAGWVLGATVPVVGLSVAVAYLCRRWELGLSYPLLGRHATDDGRRGWDGWRVVVLAGAVLTTGMLVSLFVTGDPSADGNTPAQNAAIFTYLAALPLPVLSTHFDARNVAARTEGWSAFARLLWSGSMLLWVLNVPLAGAYLYRRHGRLQALSDRRRRFEDRLETVEGAVARAESAMEAGDFDAALDALAETDGPLEAARLNAADSSAFEEYRPRRLSHRVSELRTRAEEGEERRAFEKRRGRGEAALERGETALDDEAFDEAVEAFDEAVEAFGNAAELATGLDRDPEPLREQVREAERRHGAAVEALVTERAEPLADRAEELLAGATDAIEAGEFDRATARLDEAAGALADLDALRDSYPVETTAAVDEADIDAARRRVAYREPLERAEAALDEAAEADDDDRYAAALDACDRAREAFESAATAATDHEPADPGTVADRLDDLAERRGEYLVAHLSARLTELPEPDSVEGEDPAAYETAAESYRSLLDDIGGADADRERDLAVLHDAAATELVGMRVGWLAARAGTAAAAFRAGDHADARDAFEAVGESVTSVRETAASLDVTDHDEDLDALERACSTNADAARRAVLGIEESPKLEPIPADRYETAVLLRNALADLG